MHSNRCNQKRNSSDHLWKLKRTLGVRWRHRLRKYLDWTGVDKRGLKKTQTCKTKTTKTWSTENKPVKRELIKYSLVKRELLKGWLVNCCKIFTFILKWSLLIQKILNVSNFVPNRTRNVLQYLNSLSNVRSVLAISSFWFIILKPVQCSISETKLPC